MSARLELELTLDGAPVRVDLELTDDGDVVSSDVGEGVLAIVGLGVLFGGLALAGLRRSAR